MSLPLFPVTTVGSWPRSQDLLKAQRAKRAGRLSIAEFEALADQEIKQFIGRQEEIGIDLITDGEQRRDNFYSFVAEKIEGVQLMSLGEMLDYVEDKAGFERLLQTLDVPSYAISNPTCVGPIRAKEPLAVHELRFLQKHSTRPVKIPLPGPYILTRAMWVPEVTGKHYASKEELGEHVVEILSKEVEALAREGAAFIQFDEPVLTELVFTQGQTRTFMCAALASRKDPAEELEFAINLVNRVAAAAGRVRTGVHVCRGNWSQDETTLLQGNYRPLTSSFERMNVTQLVLEYATPRAGDLIAIPGKELGYGVVNPRTEDVESVAAIEARIEEALALIPKDKLFLNPDCGFATFSMRPVNADGIAAAKMRNVVEAAKRLRLKHA